MSDESNIDAVMARLEGLIDSFNFQRKGVEGSLGKDVVMTIIRGPQAGALGGIMGRIADGVQPDGTPMRANAKEYGERKQKEYGWNEVGRRTGQSFSQVSLYGRTEIGVDAIEMRYGTDTAPDKSVSPNGHISDADKAIVDTRKATFLTHQGRAFYGFNEEDLENVIGVARESLNHLIEEWNNGMS